MIRAWLRPAVRLALALSQRVRHGAQRLKPGARLRRVVTRASKRCRQLVRSGGFHIRRRTTKFIVRTRQIIYYRVPGERRDCPACRSRQIRPVRPLSFTSAAMVAASPFPEDARPIENLWRVGFISGCESCGLLFANPLPREEQLANVYSPEGDWGRSRQDEEEELVNTGRLERIFAPIRDQLDVLAPPAGSTVLDFGCGLGGLLDTLASMGWTTYGIDPATKVAFRRHREVVDLPSTPTFDLVVLHHVLEHVAAPHEILRSLMRATHVGGFLLVSVPNLDGLPEHGDLQYCLRSKTHVMAYSSACLEQLFAAAGFDLVSVESRSVSPRGRQMVALGRRRDHAPVSVGVGRPLTRALVALERHEARTGEVPDGVLPVRFQAAELNLARERRGPSLPSLG